MRFLIISMVIFIGFEYYTVAQPITMKWRSWITSKPGFTDVTKLCDRKVAIFQFRDETTCARIFLALNPGAEPEANYVDHNDAKTRFTVAFQPLSVSEHDRCRRPYTLEHHGTSEALEHGNCWIAKKVLKEYEAVKKNLKIA